MNENKRSFKLNRESPLFQLFVSLLTILVVGGTLAFILILAGRVIFGSDLTVLNKATSEFSTNDSGFLRYLLIIQDISLFIVPSVIIMRLMKPIQSTGLSELKMPRIKEIGFVVLLAFCMFPVTSFTAQLNSAMHLPEWLSGVEQWMTQKENKADDMIELLVVSDTFLGMILNLVTIAIFPAIAEEMLFRGVFQKIFQKLFRSGHIAIWVTAFLFSTIHFQFFGFIPRFLLGLAFGYIYFWSGILLFPVILHFINNAFPVILVYVQGMEQFNMNTVSPLWKQALALPVPIVIGIVILFYFRKKSKETDLISENREQET
jgi:hypothetical protein